MEELPTADSQSGSEKKSFVWCSVVHVGSSVGTELFIPNSPQKMWQQTREMLQNYSWGLSA